MHQLLIATTGFILAAIDAGIIPERIPRTTHIEIASNIILPEIIIGKGNTTLSIAESNHTMVKPIRPPIRQRNALSSKNSNKIVLLFAPIAFLNRFDWCVL